MSTAVSARNRYMAAFLATAVAMAAAMLLWMHAGAQEAAGFDGFIQSGTCDAPTDDLLITLESEEDFDIAPYLAKAGDADSTITLAYYGAPEAPGFGYAAIFTDVDFSLVITAGGADDPVACGNLYEPDDDNFSEAGLAVVRLHQVSNSGIEGVAIVERSVVQRETDVITTRVRIMLLTDLTVAPASGTPEATPAA